MLGCEWNNEGGCVSKNMEIASNHEGMPICSEFSDDSLSIHNMQHWLVRDAAMGHIGLSDTIRYKYTFPTFDRCWREAINRAEGTYSEVVATDTYRLEDATKIRVIFPRCTEKE